MTTKKRLDKKESELRKQLETERVEGNAKNVERILKELANLSEKRTQVNKYIKDACEKPRENHKKNKKREAIDEQVEEDDEEELKKLKIAIYDGLVAKINPAEPNGEIC